MQFNVQMFFFENTAKNLFLKFENPSLYHNDCIYMCWYLTVIMCYACTFIESFHSTYTIVIHEKKNDYL